MKIVINPAYSSVSDFIKSLPTTFHQSGEIIYKGRNEIRKFDVENYTFAVKAYKLPILFNRFIYTFFRTTKACRAYEHALHLLHEGISTPVPVAYLETKRGGLFSYGYFVSVLESHEYTLHTLWQIDEEEQKKVLKEFAQFSLKLHEKRILHLDYSPGNVLITQQDQGYNFSLIDLNRMKFCTLGRKGSLHNFERMLWDEPKFVYFISQYAQLRGWSVDETVSEALKYRVEFEERIKRRKAMKQLIKKDKKA